MAEEQQPEGKFNIAITYLLSINEIFKDIKNISLRTSNYGSSEYLLRGRGQELKLKLVRNLYVQASSLFKKPEETGEIWDKIKKVEMKTRDINEHRIYIKEKKLAPIYDSDVENELDNIIILIQHKLQDLKLLMPEKGESGLF